MVARMASRNGRWLSGTHERYSSTLVAFFTPSSLHGEGKCFSDERSPLPRVRASENEPLAHGPALASVKGQAGAGSDEGGDARCRQFEHERAIYEHGEDVAVIAEPGIGAEAGTRRHAGHGAVGRRDVRE